MASQNSDITLYTTQTPNGIKVRKLCTINYLDARQTLTHDLQLLDLHYFRGTWVCITEDTALQRLRAAIDRLFIAQSPFPAAYIFARRLIGIN